MNKKISVYTISTFSLFSALMMVTFIVMAELRVDTFGALAKVFCCIGGVGMIVSSFLTILTINKGMEYDDFQMKNIRCIRDIIRVIAEIALPVICIIGLILNSIGFVVSIGMLVVWILLLVEVIIALIMALK